MVQLQHFLDALYGPLLGHKESPYAAAISRALSLLGPSLRFNALFRKGSDDYRRLVLGLPAQLLATFVLSVHAATVWNKPLSLRAITELHQAHSELRSLLARLAEPVLLDGPLVATELPPSLADAATQLGQRLRHPTARSRPLGEHLLAVAGSLPVAERPLLLPVLLRAGESLRFVS